MKPIMTLIFTASLALMFDLALIELNQSHAAFAKKQQKKPAKEAATGGRKKIMVKEAKTKMNKRDKTKVDFDEATLEGRRLNPSGVALNLQKPDKEFDLIKLRRHWKPEMVSSTSSLENR